MVLTGTSRPNGGSVLGGEMGYQEKFRLEGRVAAVTGAASGIGLEACRALGEMGAALELLDFNEDSLAEAAGELLGRGVDVGTQMVDVTDPQAIESAAHAVRDQRGKVDILLNSAGIARLNSAVDTPDDEWLKVIDVNVNGTFWACRAFGRMMIEEGTGSIINMGSMSGTIINRPQHAASYMASKGAIHQLTRALAAEWAKTGVRVNALAPGYVATEMTLGMRAQPELFNTWLDMTPMARCGEPEEIASAIAFLASDASSYMTGSIVAIDGGYTVW